MCTPPHPQGGDAFKADPSGREHGQECTFRQGRVQSNQQQKLLPKSTLRSSPQSLAVVLTLALVMSMNPQRSRLLILTKRSQRGRRQARDAVVSSDLGAGRSEFRRPGPPRGHCILRSRLLTFFIKTVSCREHLSTFSFKTEMSLRVLEGDMRNHLSPCVRPVRAHVVSLGFIPMPLVVAKPPGAPPAFAPSPLHFLPIL